MRSFSSNLAVVIAKEVKVFSMVIAGEIPSIRNSSGGRLVESQGLESCTWWGRRLGGDIRVLVKYGGRGSNRVRCRVAGYFFFCGGE